MSFTELSPLKAYSLKVKYQDRHAWTNGVDTYQLPQNVTSDQGLPCLPLIQ